MTIVDNVWLDEVHKQDERLRVAHERIGAFGYDRGALLKSLKALIEVAEMAADFEWTGEANSGRWRDPDHVRRKFNRTLTDAKRAAEFFGRDSQ